MNEPVRRAVTFRRLVYVNHSLAFLGLIEPLQSGSPVGAAVLNIVFQRSYRQALITGSLGFHLVELKDSGLLNEEDRLWILEFHHADISFQLRHVDDLEIALIKEVAFSVKELQHAPEVTELTVGLRLLVLIPDAFQADVVEHP